MKRVLFVCSGNTCRSPMAEGIAKHELSAYICVSSAGTSALDGYPASELATEMARSRNVDISRHRSRLLSRTHILEADLIVTMEAKHREAVGAIEAAALDYTFLITDFCDGYDGGVPDPIGGDLEAYQRTYDLLQECIEAMGSQFEDFGGWKRP